MTKVKIKFESERRKVDVGDIFKLTSCEMFTRE